MSSVKKRIIIEEYENGGYGILEDGKKDVMGLMNIEETMIIVESKLRRVDEE